jgi:hypothetical protein
MEDASLSGISKQTCHDAIVGLQPRIHRLALQGENAEDALVDPP